ncbi:hypothetical protein NA57DRAFT_59572 [Rhizodiscina lignyota]|uniref:Fork-head domain-containing protein n=1 Tax=Rhizodiscina lignyota TaxID=1504668 RepID=A0A9P4I8T6_9PEZI|nr:hypothetical protein NA57DRAFT_59572 [Rhizodiscina lignyota]
MRYIGLPADIFGGLKLPAILQNNEGFKGHWHASLASAALQLCRELAGTVPSQSDHPQPQGLNNPNPTAFNPNPFPLSPPFSRAAHVPSFTATARRGWPFEVRARSSAQTVERKLADGFIESGSHRLFTCPYFHEATATSCAWCDPEERCPSCVSIWNRLRRPRFRIDGDIVSWSIDSCHATAQTLEGDCQSKDHCALDYDDMTDDEEDGDVGSRNGELEATNTLQDTGESSATHLQESASNTVKPEIPHSPEYLFSREIPSFPLQQSNMEDPDELQDTSTHPAPKCENGHELPSLNNIQEQEKVCFEGGPSQQNGNQSARISAYAKLQFEDGAYYMNTISVILGRDLEVSREARRQVTRQKRQNSVGEVHTPVVAQGEDSRTVVSASGGFVGRNPKPRKHKSNKSKSGSSTSDPVRTALPLPATTFQHALDVDSPEVDVAALLPDPYEEPLVAIHEPVASDGTISLSKSISRKHCKIAYNYVSDGFEMTILGRNGAFVDNQHYDAGAVVSLHHGSEIQVGGVKIAFNLPTEALPDGDQQSSSGRMSFAFEDETGGDIDVDDSADDFEDLDVARRPRLDPYWSQGDDSQDAEEDSGSEDQEEEVQRPQRVKLTQKKQLSASKPSKVTLKNGHKKSGKAREIPRAQGEKEPEKKKPAKISTHKAAKKRLSAKEDVADVATSIEGAEEDAISDTPAAAQSTLGKKRTKTPAEASKRTKSKSPTDDSGKPQVNRDQALVNGEGGINVEGLQPGTVIPARRKGPGRPPKDGIMSKREKALIAKREKERERAIKLGEDPDNLPPLDLSAPKPRPKDGSKDANATETPNAPSMTPNVEAGEDSPAEKRVVRPSKVRTPSPEMKEEDFTREQLERPAGNYVSLLYEVLQEKGKLNLQQIYVAMEKKWPFFRFRGGSGGWQSSVRHNLGQHDAFRKVEKDGKGYTWEINPDVSIEPVKKQKKQATPPPPPQPPRAYNHQYHAPGSYPSQPHGYPPPLPNGTYPNRGPQYQQTGVPAPLGGAPPVVGPGQQPSNYSSPYAPAPAASGHRPPAAQYPNGTTPTTQHPPAQYHGLPSNPPNAQRPPGPANATPAPHQQGQSAPPPARGPWSRDALLTTVSRIYADKVPPGTDLDRLCSRAIDAFLFPDQFQRTQAPLHGMEVDIVNALAAAHESQKTGRPVQTPAPPTMHGGSAPSQSQSPAPQQSLAQAQAQTVPHASTPVQSQPYAPPPRGQTPQAPQPEPLTRPNSVHSIRQDGSHTPPLPPQQPAAQMPANPVQPAPAALPNGHDQVSGSLPMPESSGALKRSAEEAAGSDDETKRARIS